jgi:dihydroorotate dehydrogenase electron transfer subunit
MNQKHRQQVQATVLENRQLCREHYRLVLGVADFAQTEPGQFIQVSCRPVEREDEISDDLQWDQQGRPEVCGEELTGRMALLRRPFSLAGRKQTADGVELHLIHRVVGVGTQWLSDLAVGERVGVLGPLGNRFELPRPDGMAILVGGGVGIPPMLYLAQRLAGRKAVAFCGALTRDLLPMTLLEGGTAGRVDAVEPLLNVEEFSRHGIPAVISTDDGSFGFRGFVTQALERYLDANAQAMVGAVIYTCGPEGMMKRVAEIAASRGIECQVAVERAMACGMGTCQSCVIRVRKPDPAVPPMAGKDWCYRLACTDGPVFKGSDLLW